MTKLIVTFSNSTNTPKNVSIIFAAVQFYGVSFQEMSLERQRIRKKIVSCLVSSLSIL
jgi:hypothetical protein